MTTDLISICGIGVACVGTRGSCLGSGGGGAGFTFLGVTARFFGGLLLDRRKAATPASNPIAPMIPRIRGKLLDEGAAVVVVDA
jgi:hypothetical protein